MERNIDLLYVLGTGSNWNNNEIRFSLRSVHQNLKDVGKIWIVGHDPGGLKNINFIPHPDEIGPHNADGNITRKIIRACREEGLSDTFIKMNDDYLIIKPISTHDIVPMHKGDLTEKRNSYFSVNPWRKRLKRTMEALVEKGLPALHFDYHAPIPISKHDFEKTVSLFEYEHDIGICTRSMYGNIVYPDAYQLTYEKEKVFAHLTLEQINQLTECALFLAYNDDGLNQSLKYWLGYNFPDPSPYEEILVDDKYVEIGIWDKTGRDYEHGVEIFKKHYASKNMARLFTSYKTESLSKKLHYKLNSRINQL